jgi:hypothetical protein
MYAQIEKNRSSNHCLICISKKSNKTELKKHIYNMHFWMLGKHAHKEIRYSNDDDDFCFGEEIFEPVWPD